MEKITVELCMGSSCFARGNAQTLATLERYIADKHLEERVDLIGHLCLGACSKGPNIKIGEITHSGVSSDCVIDLLEAALHSESVQDRNGR
ncbi:(2Fe-2S) ferredoxin domain-containing protein [Sphaerochaeta sp. PS]|uniref:(2Fe-2S) ferredoxin domain-containing protein n=1 Tax=Sphaerochaeta sp. PS TaxID=3076336 RepID=UPI0028A3AD66|nr:NAD(P)H-dependent oxidoreductase subunit E [Sphaerochaeta sp. PS]MDT4762668.1 NAD(P)H-dependent oxidoreductase subunit E [Sphaerochaeta sp. PS]